jgi:hypothetical protein
MQLERHERGIHIVSAGRTAEPSTWRPCLTSAGKGESLERWQYEVTGGGHIWYVIDDANRTAWITHAGPGHPTATG